MGTRIFPCANQLSAHSARRRTLLADQPPSGRSPYQLRAPLRPQRQASRCLSDQAPTQRPSHSNHEQPGLFTPLRALTPLRGRPTPVRPSPLHSKALVSDASSSRFLYPFLLSRAPPPARRLQNSKLLFRAIAITDRDPYGTVRNCGIAAPCPSGYRYLPVYPGTR